MTHPVPPPEPPPVVQILSTKAQHSVPTDAPMPFSTAQLLTANRLVSLTPLKSSLPVPAPLGAVKKAANLGSPMAVGYSLERVEAITYTDHKVAEAIAATPESLNHGGTNTATLSGAIAPKTITSSQTKLSQNQRQVSPRPAAVMFNQRLASQESPPGREGNTPPAAHQPLEFSFLAPTAQQQPTTPNPAQEQTQPPIEQTAPQSPTQPARPPGGRRIVEVTSDRQEYDEQRQIVTAEGNVLVRFDGAVLDADRLQVNLPNLIAVGEGNVALTRGQQVLRGERFTYNIVQDSGNIQGGRGEIFIPSASSDFSPTLPTDVSGGVPVQPASDRITANQPLQQVNSAGGLGITVGSGNALPQGGGGVRRVRFEAEQIEFNPTGWQARDVRLTNDPFSPPELELRANTVTLTRETPFRDRIKTTRQRLVFDQGFSLPIPRNQATIDRQQREVSPGLAQIGYDGEDRGGVYVERSFTPIDTDAVQLSLKPQYFVQQAVEGDDDGPFAPSQFGLRTNLNANLGPRTAFNGYGIFTSLDLGDIEDNLRASLRLRQVVGDRLPHTLNLEYAYRDRIFNGTLGYRTVQSSIGGTVSSPVIPLGNTGINLSYQGGAQYINADTNRRDLLEPGRENNRVSLSRFQGSAALSRGFLLWQGKGLPATATAGLRYTPAPVVPFISAFAGVTGNSSFYSNGDNQTILTGTIGVRGQFGHFSRSFFDYTGFNLSFSQGIRTGESPFLFDRSVDNSRLTVGLNQQVYGPFRLGIQTSLNLETGESISTDYVLEYSRRTYGVTLRYNPDLELGALSLRISDFNWAGGTDPFSGSEVRPVVDGVQRENE